LAAEQAQEVEGAQPDLGGDAREVQPLRRALGDERGRFGSAAAVDGALGGRGRARAGGAADLGARLGGQRARELVEAERRTAGGRGARRAGQRLQPRQRRQRREIERAVEERVVEVEREAVVADTVLVAELYSSPALPSRSEPRPRAAARPPRRYEKLPRSTRASDARACRSGTIGSAGPAEQRTAATSTPLARHRTSERSFTASLYRRVSRSGSSCERGKLPDVIGEVVGSYRILEQLGQGGMGAVYLAEHTLIGRKAAVKVLLPKYSSDESVVNRFFNEARAAASISHPGLVDVMDYGHRENGCAFLIMEYLVGETLGARLARERRLPVEPLLAIGRQIAHVMTATHARGIIHRDLKPDNIFLVEEPDLPFRLRVKVLDFGIAKLTSTEGDPNLKTRSSALIGTPTYMSPEQCRGAGFVDLRTDIYALGCILFQMAVGRPPFIGEGPGDVMGAHMRDPAPEPSSVNPLLPERFDRLVLRALAKDPNQRYPTMVDFVREMDALGMPTDPAKQPDTSLSGAASESLSLPMSGSRRWLAIAGGAALVIAGVVGYRQLAPAPTVSAALPAAPPPPAPKPAPEPAPRLVRLQIESDPAGADVFRASDGKLMGRTPLDDIIPAKEGRESFLIKRAGYDDERIELPASQDAFQRLALRALKRAPVRPARPVAAPAAPAAEPKAPTIDRKVRVVNPFDN
jgi:serine/threonine-protein kinase